MLKISENIRAVKAKIAAAAEDAERDPASVSLLAVSKTIAEDKISEAIKAGQNKFGENRVQEVEGKWPALREAGASLELHLIGALQTNKTRTAVALFDMRAVISEVMRKSVASTARGPYSPTTERRVSARSRAAA